MSAFITALGARSPVGLNAEQTAMGLRHAHPSPRRTKFMDRHGESIGMSLLGALPDDLEGLHRMVALAAPALGECVAAHQALFPASVKTKPIVLLGCPAPRPGFGAADATALLEAVVNRANVDACPQRSAVFPGGHASFAQALERALGEMANAKGTPIFVGSVDSFYDVQTVAHYESDLRILSLRTPDGFLPAEGAAFLALNSQASTSAPTYGEVIFAATDNEFTIVEDQPNLARASTELLVRAARARRESGLAKNTAGDRSTHPLGWYLRTTNRERHRAREEKFVMTRRWELFHPEKTRIDELAENIGDAGAASGALLSVFACQGFASGYAPHSAACIALASDGPERGVIVLENQPN